VVLSKLVAPIRRSRSAQQNHYKSIEPDTGIWEFRKLAAQSTATAARATANAAERTGAFATLRRPVAQRQWRGISAGQSTTFEPPNGATFALIGSAGTFVIWLRAVNRDP
jgi:hypothetical protein